MALSKHLMEALSMSAVTDVANLRSSAPLRGILARQNPSAVPTVIQELRPLRALHNLLEW